MRVSFGTTAANSFGRGFLRHLAAEAAWTKFAGAAARNCRDAAERLFAARGGRFPDRQARMVVGMCVLVLAAYRELRAAGADPSEAYAITRRAFLRTYGTPIRLAVRLLLALARDPVKTLSRKPLIDICARMYGASMQFDQQETSDGIQIVVNRCAYHEFFLEAGEPHLTQIVCGWDRNWMDVIDASARPVRVERPAAISAGEDRCRFHLIRDEPGGPKRHRDVILEPGHEMP